VLKLLNRLRESVGSTPGDDEFRALGQESVRDRQADTARSAGDQDTLPVDVHDCSPTSLSCVLVSKSLAS